jgi:Bacterial TSP3 repeat
MKEHRMMNPKAIRCARWNHAFRSLWSVAAVIVLVTSAAASPARAQLVFEWSFDDDSGNTGSSVTGTITFDSVTPGSGGGTGLTPDSITITSAPAHTPFPNGYVLGAEVIGSSSFSIANQPASTLWDISAADTITAGGALFIGTQTDLFLEVGPFASNVVTYTDPIRITQGLNTYCAVPLQTDGFDTTVSTAGGLQQAMVCANANGNSLTDTIRLGANITISAAVDFTNGANATPSVTVPMLIDGQGYKLSRDDTTSCASTLDGTEDPTEFRLLHVGSTGDLTVQDLFLENGCADGSGGGANFGGGIYNGATLTVTRSSLDGHRAQSNGGAIFNGLFTTVTITNSTLSNNTGGNAGAIYNNGTIPLISNSTFSGNTGGFGGTLVNNNSLANITAIENSTFWGNTSGGFGAAIDNAAGTIGNLTNTIITGSAGGPGCTGSFSGSNNLTDSGCPGDVGDVTGFDATLSDNGCATPGFNGCPSTHALSSGSNALDATVGGTSTDQRGYSAFGTRDIGAWESADQDGDGLSELQEVTLGTNPDLADSDTDGLDDGEEIIAGTNPLNPDTDGDGAPDGSDPTPLDPATCGDVDSDTCDDCAVAPTSNPANDGLDTDSDGLCDAGDADDDNDGVVDGSDADPLLPTLCEDSDADTCDDCSIGTDGFGPLADNDPSNDGRDGDGDGVCNATDTTINVTLDFAGRPLGPNSTTPEMQWRRFFWKEDGFTIRVIPGVFESLVGISQYPAEHEMFITPDGGAYCGGEETLTWQNWPACGQGAGPSPSDSLIVMELTHDSGAPFDLLSVDELFGSPLRWDGSNGASIDNVTGQDFSFGGALTDITSVTFTSYTSLDSNVLDNIALKLDLDEVPGPTPGTFIDETFDFLHGNTEGWDGFFSSFGTISITWDFPGAGSPGKVYGIRITPGTYVFTLDVSEVELSGTPIPSFVPDFMMNGASPDQTDTSDTDLSDGALWSFSFEVAAGDPIVGEQLDIVFGIPPALVGADPARAYELHQFTANYVPEPGTTAGLIAGCGLLALLRRRRNTRPA